MKKTIVSRLCLIILLAYLPATHVFANNRFSNNLNQLTDLSWFGSKSAAPMQFSVKSGVPYDASKDPALRQGTENWEQPQGSFFVIPAVVLGVVGLMLFFSKDDL